MKGQEPLEEKFIWVKKQKLDEQKGLTPVEIERIEAGRMARNRHEIEKLERQRLEWEAEKERKQREKESVQFTREREMLGDWQEKERLFHKSQALAKAEVRIKSSRSDLFDWIILNTAHDADIQHIFDGDIIELINFGLISSDSIELVDKIEDHIELERDVDNLNYLHAISVYISQDRQHPNESSQISIVKDEVISLLSGKTVAELSRLETSIKDKLSKPGIYNRDFWEDVLLNLAIFRRKALVLETSRIMVDKRKGQLGERTICLTVDDWRLGGETPLVGADLIAPTPTPSPLSSESETQINWDPSQRSISMFEDERDRRVHSDEIPFNTEAEDLKIVGKDLIRPRFFNRVRTSFEWNKYNQTHYDTDNPPPKAVQGYRFNIFYPQLPSDSKSPTYKVESDPHLPDTKIVRFIAGPPYEDLVFRIEGDEWDMSHRQGFKCSFEAGILRLHFWFKSQRYRR